MDVRIPPPDIREDASNPFQCHNFKSLYPINLILRLLITSITRLLVNALVTASR
jgi:hypothetical protein